MAKKGRKRANLDAPEGEGGSLEGQEAPVPQGTASMLMQFTFVFSQACSVACRVGKSLAVEYWSVHAEAVV